MIGRFGTIQLTLNFIAALADALRANDAHACHAQTADILCSLLYSDVIHSIAMFA